MTTSPRSPSAFFRRRARARMSITVTLGLSSMKMGALLNRVTAVPELGPVLGADLTGLEVLPVHLRL